MRTLVRIAALAASSLAFSFSAGCPGGSSVNPFLTLVEQQFIPFNEEEVDSDEPLRGGALDGVEGGGGATTVDTRFRDAMTITFNNHSARGDLEFNFLAWVNAISVQTDEERDALFNSNYVELQTEVQLGLAYILAPGTFVYNGGGKNGNLRFRIRRGVDSSTEGASNEPGDFEIFDEGGINAVSGDGGTDASTPGTADTPVSQELTLATPDHILIYLDAPVSCDSVAFVFLDQGDVLSIEGGGAIRDEPFKPLSAAEFVQCDPLDPGLNLKTGGGARLANEFFEGEDVVLDFFLLPQLRTGDLRDINLSSFLFATFGGIEDGGGFVSILESDDEDGDDGGTGDGDGDTDGDGPNVLTP